MDWLLVRTISVAVRGRVGQTRIYGGSVTSAWPADSGKPRMDLVADEWEPQMKRAGKQGTSGMASPLPRRHDTAADRTEEDEEQSPRMAGGPTDEEGWQARYRRHGFATASPPRYGPQMRKARTGSAPTGSPTKCPRLAFICGHHSSVAFERSRQRSVRNRRSGNGPLESDRSFRGSGSALLSLSRGGQV